MTRLAILTVLLLLPAAARAEIGDPCDAAGVCPPGWFCFPEAGTPGYCTTVCPEAGCPEGFSCRTGGGPRDFCLKGDGPPPLAGLGDPCEGADACEMPLTCFTDNAERYCSQFCTVPGSCPEGYRCQSGAAPACARNVNPPGGLEPCAGGTMCAPGFDCVTHPARTLPFCAFPCPDGVCDGGLTCVEGHCLPNPWPGQPAFGERCVAAGAEPKVVGCADGGLCLPGGADAYCTRVCDIDKPCPEGYGCRGIEPGRAECRRGVPNDEYYTPMAFPDGGFPDPADVLPPPMQAVEQEGGSDEKASGGCAVVGPSAQGGARVELAGLAAALFGLRVRRRGRRAAGDPRA